MFHKFLNLLFPSQKLANNNQKVNNYICEIKDLSLSFNKQPILNNISFSIKQGEITTIIGPNGGGKTSLLRTIIGIYKNYQGQVEFANKPVIGYLPQHFNVNNLMPITVEYFLQYSFFHQAHSSINIETLIKDIPIKKILNNQVTDISEGELQLVLLARCILMKPDIIILDEPVSCMDVNARKKFYQLIKELVNLYNLTILMSSHDLNFVIPNSDHVICINNSLLCQGTPTEIVKNKHFIKTFSHYNHNV